MCSEHLSLEELDVSHCSRLTDVSIAYFIARVKRIRVLSMGGMAQLSDAAISPMNETPVIYGTKKCDGCKHLTRINVRPQSWANACTQTEAASVISLYDLHHP